MGYQPWNNNSDRTRYSHSPASFSWALSAHTQWRSLTHTSRRTSVPGYHRPPPCCYKNSDGPHTPKLELKRTTGLGLRAWRGLHLSTRLPRAALAGCTCIARIRCRSNEATKLLHFCARVPVRSWIGGIVRCHAVAQRVRDRVSK